MDGITVEVTQADVAAAGEHPLVVALRRCLPGCSVEVDARTGTVDAIRLGERQLVFRADDRLRDQLRAGSVPPGSYQLARIGTAEPAVPAAPAPAVDRRTERRRERQRKHIGDKRRRLGLVKKGRPERREERLSRARERVAKWRAGRGPGATSSG